MSAPETRNFDSVYGPFVDRGLIERNTMAHVQNWLVRYLSRIEAGVGLTSKTLAIPRSWDIVNQFTRFPEDQLPWVAVVSTGTHGGRPPRQEGDGSVTAWWLVAIGAIVSASDAEAAKDLAGYYGAAIRLLMTQKPSLGGWAYGCDWEDERYDDFGRLQERNLAGVRLVFTIEVHDVVNIYGGESSNPPPAAPPTDPYTDPVPYPTVKQGGVSVTINKES